MLDLPIIMGFMHIAAIAKRRSEREKLFVCYAVFSVTVPFTSIPKV